jgi:nicotinate-nucleotide adenylyltransferase
MVKLKNKSIGILGGSFDPAHKGHLIISKTVLKKIKLDKILWIVTKQNPFKKKPLYSLEQRLKFARSLTKKIKKINVVHFDGILRSSRTINTINYLLKKKKYINMYYIIGSDNLITFHKWKSWKKIVKLSKLTVLSRKVYDKRGKNSLVAKYLKNKIIFIKNKPIIISSTKLRKELK